MTCHIWGDDWEHWDTLYKAQHWFIKLYERVTGKYPQTKEKYGTIRYEYEYLWLIVTDDEGEVVQDNSAYFKEIIRRTVKKFPEVAAELVADAGYMLNDEYFEGWCNGIMFVKGGSYWSSTKRPRGV